MSLTCPNLHFCDFCYSLNRRSLQSCLNTAPPPTDECVGYIYPFNRIPKVANVNYDVVLRVTFTIPVSHSKKNVCFVETWFEASFICRDIGIWRSGSEDFWVKDSVLRLYSGSGITVVLSLYTLPSGNRISSTFVMAPTPTGTHDTERQTDLFASRLTCLITQATKSLWR